MSGQTRKWMVVAKPFKGNTRKIHLYYADLDDVLEHALKTLEVESVEDLEGIHIFEAINAPTGGEELILRLDGGGTNPVRKDGPTTNTPVSTNKALVPAVPPEETEVEIPYPNYTLEEAA